VTAIPILLVPFTLIVLIGGFPGAMEAMIMRPSQGLTGWWRTRRARRAYLRKYRWHVPSQCPDAVACPLHRRTEPSHS
jgi:hypothetical protein